MSVNVEHLTLNIYLSTFLNFGTLTVMKIPLSWLQELISLDGLPVESLAEKLTLLGVEVESIESSPLNFEGVIVGRVLAAEKHPNADTLQIASVTDGKELYQVVCGAANCRAGLKVAFCPIGSTVCGEKGEPFKIKKAKIRGVESFGMLAAADELGLADSSEGILELPESLVEGRDLKTLYGETILDVALTPNLNHVASMVGIARELSAVLERPLRLPLVTLIDDAEQKTSSLVSVEVKNFEKCPRYTARVILGVTVAPSPDWLKNRLERAGIRAINNVVDITNYVLLETGQPLHAFDLDLLEEKKIVVREAVAGEMIETLDQKKRTLQEGQLVIADGKKPIALAGIMGGASEQVTGKTVNILLESAYFHPSTIRRASKYFGLLTDSSRRFERGADPNGVIPALDRAAALLQEMAGGRVTKGHFDLHEKEFVPLEISCRLSRVNELLGLKLSASEVERLLTRLQFHVRWKDGNTLLVTVPTYRVDVTQEIDLVEEVGRLFGVGNIPRHHPRFQLGEATHAPIFLFEREIRDLLVGEGLQETLNCDLISPTLVELVMESITQKGSVIKVLNPTSIDQSCLRPSLLPGLLEVVRYNQDHQVADISAFELGRIHFREENQYKEQSVAAILLTGREKPHEWDVKTRTVDFFDLKGILENLLEGVGIDTFEIVPSQMTLFHPGRQAYIKVGDSDVGILGEIHPALLRKMAIRDRLFFAEVNLHDLIPLQKGRARFKELAQYPGSIRDWTVTLPENVPYNRILQMIQSQHCPLLEQVTLIDLYRSDRIGKDNKNSTLRFVYRALDRTLSQEEVDEAHSSLTQETLKRLGKVVI